MRVAATRCSRRRVASRLERRERASDCIFTASSLFVRIVWRRPISRDVVYSDRKTGVVFRNIWEKYSIITYPHTKTSIGVDLI